MAKPSDILEPEQLELDLISKMTAVYKDVSPVCRQTGCKHETLFKAVRKLQEINARLEKFADHAPLCKRKLFGSDFICDCGYDQVMNEE